VTTARHPTCAELLESAIRTVEDVLTPELASDWARGAAIGLVGQLRYALAREAGDTLDAQDTELSDCLEALANEFPAISVALSEVPKSGDVSWDLREQAGRLLVFALADTGDAGDAVRARLRPLLVAHVSQDLVQSGPMLQAFLASGSLGSSG